MAASRLRRSKAARPPRRSPGGCRPLRQIFTITRESDPLLPLWMLLAFAGTVLVAFLIGLAAAGIRSTWPLGVPLGVLLALSIMSRRAERFAYERAAGQPGVTGQVMKNIRRGWYVEEEPVAIDPRTRDLVFRAVGRPGVVLVTEGPVPRPNRLVEGERKRVTRVAGPERAGASCSTSGTARARCPLRKLDSKMMRSKPSLTKTEAGRSPRG